MEKTTRTQKVKDHVKKHKGVYIAGTAGVAVGATAAVVLTKSNIQIVDSCKVTLLQWKSPTVNTVQLVSRTNASNAVQCLETGEVFASQNRAADLLGISKSALSKHLNGLRPHASGLHFQRLTDAAANIA